MSSVALPVREPALPGESLTSFVRRHAQAMGYDRLSLLLSLLSDTSLPVHLDELHSEPELSALANLLRCEPGVLRSMTVHHYYEQLVFESPTSSPTVPVSCDSRTILRFFSLSTSPLCPACLSDSIPYDRLFWTFKPIPVCLMHRCALIENCPQCQRRILPRRISTRYCGCGWDFAQTKLPIVSEHVISLCEHVSCWLNGTGTPSKGLPATAAVHWLERLSSALERAPVWQNGLRDEFSLPELLSNESVAWLGAADVIVGGSPRLTEFLAIYEEVAKHRTSSTGASRAFGLLLRDAHRLEQHGFSKPAEQLRTYLVERFTRGHINRKNILFRQAAPETFTQQRPWLTQTVAAKFLHLRHGTVAELVRRGVLMGRISEAGVQGRTIGLVSRDSVDALQRVLSTALTLQEAAARLGLDRHRVLGFIEANELCSAIRTSRGWMIPNAEVRRLLDRYLSLPLTGRRSTVWLSAREATRRFGKSGMNFVRLWRLIRQGLLDGRRDSRVATLQGLFVDARQLPHLAEDVLAEQNAAQGYPLQQLARILIPGRHVKDVVLRKWITAGLLHAEREQSAWRISAAEAERFHSTYCLADEACQQLKISRQTLARRETAGQIAAVYSRRSHAGAGASLFRRCDIETLLSPVKLPS